jgi:hypothetical protein
MDLGGSVCGRGGAWMEGSGSPDRSEGAGDGAEGATGEGDSVVGVGTCDDWWGGDWLGDHRRTGLGAGGEVGDDVSVGGGPAGAGGVV